VRARLANPLDWDAADKCTLAAVIVGPFVGWYLLWAYYFQLHPDAAAYLDRQWLTILIRFNWLLLIGWLTVPVAASPLRGRTAGRYLVHVVVQLYALGFAGYSYLLGHYSGGYTTAVALAGGAAGLIIFGRRPILIGAVSYGAVIAATTAAEQLGRIPYAPVLTAAPWASGHLSSYWLASYGLLPMAILLAGLLLVDYVVDRWHARENDLAKTTDQLARANELISRYVATQVAQQIRTGNYGAVDRHDRRKLTLFFSDIKGFTEIADTIEPEDLSRILNEYLSEMTGIAERYEATIDKFVGDAMMIFFGAPLATHDRDHALRAVRMALEMQGRLDELRAKWLGEGIEEPFQVRIGINTGVASVGNFGSRGRVDYTAIGRQVNLAARLQVNCDPGKILISHSTWSLVHDEIACVAKGEIQVKGFHQPVKVYEVAG
jgi:adenylate cyclase